ncbi:nuclear transport factor 2 family protein [Streptomyces sp. N2-109]|uniref:Nuclear transport factor 2 family protein n=1 Tax=Streptomyces gossypii TaxID=2883101 RepID=A0ABT2JR74_9ACTN|nr:nuclear transport factor 2 family protein [Streptomyces gossypii]MCT2589764.1 nuclear transport factor 2 family protein [Streptomyces gossypii]
MDAQQSRGRTTASETVRRAWRAFASSDAEQIAACFTEDAQWLAPAGNATAVALGVPSHMKSREAIVRFLTLDFPRLFTEEVAVSFRGFHAVGDGDVVVVEEAMEATLSNGNRYSNDYCFIFELRGGLIHRVREYMDTARGARMVFGSPDGSPGSGLV